jgi:NAD(P)-dependent dehydrogenase (short-subunit alcohol dehydrogenase family)
VTRVVAVTGAASGIGAATAARLGDAEWRVIGVDLRDADVTADLGAPEGRRAAIAGITKRAGGRLDALVTCAGVGGFPGRSGSQVVSINYFGTVELLSGLRPLLAAADQPAAVAISSNSTTIQPGWPAELADACLAGDEARARALADGGGSLTAYPASKAAVARWVRRNAPGPEWAGAGICLNAIAPGKVETALIAEARADPTMAPLVDAFPMPVGRAGAPDEIAALIAFLLGPDARFFVGSVVFVDGGTDALLRPDDWPALWHLES